MAVFHFDSFNVGANYFCNPHPAFFRCCLDDPSVFLWGGGNFQIRLRRVFNLINNPAEIWIQVKIQQGRKLLNKQSGKKSPNPSFI